MPLEPCTRKVLAEKYGSPTTRAFRDLGRVAQDAARIMARMFQPRTCRLCGVRPGHHDGCPLEVKA